MEKRARIFFITSDENIFASVNRPILARYAQASYEHTCWSSCKVPVIFIRFYPKLEERFDKI